MNKKKMEGRFPQVFWLFLFFSGILIQARAEELWISLGTGGGLPGNHMKTICSLDMDGEIGFSATGLFGIPLLAGIDIGYAGYLPADDWVESMNGLRAVAYAGYRIPLGNRFHITPRVGGGLQYLLLSSARDADDYEAGSYDEQRGIQGLFKAGVALGFLPAASWSIGFDIDYLMLIETGSPLHGTTLTLSLDRRIAVTGKRKELRPPRIRTQAEVLYSTLLLLQDEGNIRVTRNGTTITVIIEDSFGPYQAEPIERTSDQLSRMAEILEHYTIQSIVIAGYVAETGDGDREVDRELSLQRAEAVREMLSTSGIPLDPAAVVAEGRGTENPVADNLTPEGRARNRRVEITLYISEEDAP